MNVFEMMTPLNAEREFVRLRVEVKRLQQENNKLLELVRLTNDKMAERERVARHELIVDAMGKCPSTGNERLSQFWAWMGRIRDANAPKD